MFGTCQKRIDVVTSKFMKHLVRKAEMERGVSWPAASEKKSRIELVHRYKATLQKSDVQTRVNDFHALKHAVTTATERASRSTAVALTSSTRSICRTTYSRQ